MALPDCLRITGAALSLALSFAGGLAEAADLRPPLPASDFVPPLPVESGWYLRIDATATFPNAPSDNTPDNPTGPGLTPLVGLRLTDAAGYGGGIGYRLNEWLRVDATVDQRLSSRYTAYSSRSNFTTGYNVEAGDLTVLTGLVNVYADLGTWWGLTPYVGAGIGVADNLFRGNYTQTTCLVAGCDGGPGAGPRSPALRVGRGVTTLAWGVTAGLSYRIWDGLSVDAAYRYIDFGEAKSGVDAYGASTRLKDLTASEFRFGLRYQFAGGVVPGLRRNPYGN